MGVQWLLRSMKILLSIWERNGALRVNTCVLSCFTWVWLFATPWTVAHQVLLSMGFSRQEYWSGLPCSPLGDLPDLGIEPTSPAAPALQAGSLWLSHQGSPRVNGTPQIHVHPGRVNGTLFGDRVFADVVKLGWDHPVLVYWVTCRFPTGMKYQCYSQILLEYTWMCL